MHFIFMSVKIKTNSFLAAIAARKLKAEKLAMVIGDVIHLHNTSAEEFLQNERWVKHEMVHVEQYKRYGIFMFLLLYTWYSIKYGYSNNPLEVEARAKEKEPHC
ncbi:MAG: eCIS core domain-containing protein [Lacibacter sp.]